MVVADEPNHALFVPETHAMIAMPGRPAQLLPRGDHLYVTVRDAHEGGLLLEMGMRDHALVELRRVVIAYDAWGMASSTDDQTIVVTSAWSHRVTVIDRAEMRVRSSIDVGREPRGVVVRENETAYVSYLVSGAVDRIDGLSKASPKRTAIDLPLAPLRSANDVAGSLGYALALSGDGVRLFAPRHALGGSGRDAWLGVSTVDVLLTGSDRPLVPRAHLVSYHPTVNAQPDDRIMSDRGTVAIGELTPFVQPRAILYQNGTESIFVLGEGNARVVELDAEALDPTLAVRHEAELGDGCVGPSCMAFGNGELVVQCAASFTWVRVPLPLGSAANALRTYAADPLPEAAARGRRLFVDARDARVSGGLGCAGCHPDGRDDGHVWHEIDTARAGIDTPFDVEARVFVGGTHVAETDGLARQTPMLAGRVESVGPYGWKAQSPTLEARITEGTTLHRWHRAPFEDEKAMKEITSSIALFLRQGLIAPPGIGRPLDDEEKLGKALFERRDVGCAMCHGDGGDGVAHVISPWRTPLGFEDEHTGFKTPSLRFVSHTAPYFHDGTAQTLDELIDGDDDRMGKTNQLDARERRALVAYLRTL
ncbi:hypothetical protein BH09MYX1_BH09MYX1_19370 [soil metagenome]